MSSPFRETPEAPLTFKYNEALGTVTIADASGSFILVHGNVSKERSVFYEDMAASYNTMH